MKYMYVHPCYLVQLAASEDVQYFSLVKWVKNPSIQVFLCQNINVERLFYSNEIEKKVTMIWQLLFYWIRNELEINY